MDESPNKSIASTVTTPEHGAPQSNLAGIDVMRGIAALIVAAFHTREITWVGIHAFWQQFGLSAAPNVILGYLTLPLVWGAIGVPIFFVISGYCIHRAQALTRARTGSYRLAIGKFYWRRFFRIYPVLAGALLLTLICDWTSRHYFPNSYKLGDTGAGLFFINLLSLQGNAGPTYGSNLPLWTLSIEVQFYAVYPLLVMLMSRFGSLPTLGIIGVVNAASYFAFERRGYQLFMSYYVSWYLGALVAEMEATKLFSTQLLSRSFRRGLCGCSFAILSFGCLLLFFSPYFAFQVWAVAFSVFLLVMLRHRGDVRRNVTKVFQWLGTFSFSIYIIHLPVVVLVHSIFFNSVHQTSIVPFFATLLTAVGCAYVFSLIFERPALALSKSFKGRRLLVEPTPP
ncbi:MAG TPA: acyltransferase [Xanthobacteraceae bacterium]|jgi:peptidoglycan/LPS O-acetylase OafA/YrhL